MNATAICELLARTNTRKYRLLSDELLQSLLIKIAALTLKDNCLVGKQAVDIQGV